MINPTIDDLNSGVICKFKNGEITGTMTGYNDDSVIVTTKRGEQHFARNEVEWQDKRKREKPAAPDKPELPAI